jgi:hypothetical protein
MLNCQCTLELRHYVSNAMKKRTLLRAILIALLIVSAQAQQVQHYVLLPESEAKNLARNFPKSGPDKIDGGWQPSEPQIQTLEANLQHISGLKNYSAPNGERIEHPESYFRQYLAVVRAGRKLIYVNAVCDVKQIPYWHDHIAIVADGGSCFWQSWYDPSTEKFLEIYINGRG